MLTPAVMKKALLDYIHFFNVKDLPALLALYADDATVEDPYGRSFIQGKEAITAMYSKALEGPNWLEQVLAPRASFTNAATISFIVHTGPSGDPRHRRHDL